MVATNARQDDREIIDATVDAVTSAIPVGLTPIQMAAAAGRLARAAARQPVTTLRRSAALGADYVKIAAGTSDIAPERKDRRFGDEAFEKHPVFKRLAQAHLAGEQAVEAFLEELDLDEYKTGVEARADSAAAILGVA